MQIDARCQASERQSRVCSEFSTVDGASRRRSARKRASCAPTAWTRWIARASCSRSSRWPSSTRSCWYVFLWPTRLTRAHSQLLNVAISHPQYERCRRALRQSEFWQLTASMLLFTRATRFSAGDERRALIDTVRRHAGLQIGLRAVRLLPDSQGAE